MVCCILLVLSFVFGLGFVSLWMDVRLCCWFCCCLTIDCECRCIVGLVVGYLLCLMVYAGGFGLVW